jgi:hypothetical protein
MGVFRKFQEKVEYFGKLQIYRSKKIKYQILVCDDIDSLSMSSLSTQNVFIQPTIVFFVTLRHCPDFFFFFCDKIINFICLYVRFISFKMKT